MPHRAIPDRPVPTATVTTRKASRNLLLGGATTLFGIGLSLSVGSELGSWLVLGGLIVVVTQIHRLGRSGPKEQWSRSHSV